MASNSFDNFNKATQTIFHDSPERKLWLAVLGAAAKDAVDDNWLDYKGYPRGIHKTEDQNYFLHPTRNFYTVCAYAGLDPEYVLRKMRRALNAKQT